MGRNNSNHGRSAFLNGPYSSGKCIMKFIDVPMMIASDHIISIQATQYEIAEIVGIPAHLLQPESMTINRTAFDHVWECKNIMSGELPVSTPKQGRTIKHHNLIQAMNKKKMH